MRYGFTLENSAPPTADTSLRISRDGSFQFSGTDGSGNDVSSEGQFVMYVCGGVGAKGTALVSWRPLIVLFAA